MLDFHYAKLIELLGGKRLTEEDVRSIGVNGLKELRSSGEKTQQLDTIFKLLQEGYPRETYNLALGGNELSELPESIGLLSNLRFLSLSGNEFTEIPDVIVQLRDLQILKMSHNPICIIPSFLCHMEDITKLEFEDTHIRKIPEDIFMLKKLEFLYVDNLFRIPINIPCTAFKLYNNLTKDDGDFKPQYWTNLSLGDLNSTEDKYSVEADYVISRHLYKLYLQCQALAQATTCVTVLQHLFKDEHTGELFLETMAWTLDPDLLSKKAVFDFLKDTMTMILNGRTTSDPNARGLFFYNPTKDNPNQLVKFARKEKQEKQEKQEEHPHGCRII